MEKQIFTKELQQSFFRYGTRTVTRVILDGQYHGRKCRLYRRSGTGSLWRSPQWKRVGVPGGARTGIPYRGGALSGSDAVAAACSPREDFQGRFFPDSGAVEQLRRRLLGRDWTLPGAAKFDK